MDVLAFRLPGSLWAGVTSGCARIQDRNLEGRIIGRPRPILSYCHDPGRGATIDGNRGFQPMVQHQTTTIHLLRDTHAGSAVAAKPISNSALPWQICTLLNSVRTQLGARSPSYGWLMSGGRMQSSEIKLPGFGKFAGMPGAVTGSPTSMRRATSRFSARICASRSPLAENP